MAVAVAHHAPGQMGDHQTHPADDAADGDRRRGDQGGAEDHHAAQTFGIDAHGPGFFVAQGQNVDAPAQQQQGHQTDGHGNDGKPDVLGLGAVEAAHEPVGNGRELVLGIRHQLDHGGAGGDQGTDHDARQDQAQHTLALGPAAHIHNEQNCADGTGEGENHDPGAAQVQQDRQGRTEGGAGGGAENVGGRHGILEHTLVAGAGGGQAAAHKAGQNDPGQAVHQQQRLLSFRPEGLNVNESGTNDAAQLPQTDGVPAQGHRADDGHHQRRRQYGDEAAVGYFLSGVFHKRTPCLQSDTVYNKLSGFVSCFTNIFLEILRCNRWLRDFQGELMDLLAGKWYDEGTKRRDHYELR